MKIVNLPLFTGLLAISIISSPAPAQINFTEYVIVEDYNEPWSVSAVDMDGDEDLDILGSCRIGHKLTWWENFGSLIFVRHDIETMAAGAMGADAADLDNDGDVDVVCALEMGGRIAWWENDGNQAFTEHVLVYWQGPNYVYITDLDSNGCQDILATACEGDLCRFAWFENQGSQVFVEDTVKYDWDRSNTIHAGDIDSDGDIDLVGTASWAGELSWFENDGDQNFTEHIVYSTWARPTSPFAIDLDEDGDTDIVANICYLNQVVWFENNGEQEFTMNVIGSNFQRPHSNYPVDLDDDGDIDVLAAAIDSDQIVWYENDGEENFTKRTIISGFDGAADVFPADMDDDGDLDVLATAQWDRKISLFVSDLAAKTHTVAEIQPESFSLKQNYPNPFNPETTVEFTVPFETEISLVIYDIKGAEVKTLISGRQKTGLHRVVIDGSELSNGIYFAKLIAADFTDTIKLLLVK